MATHIIPDIHGRIEKLEGALSSLGFSHRNGAWRHSAGDTVVFLGDFIDRGPSGRGVLRIVRDMMEAGLAHAVMGNHELNAIHYHTEDPSTGEALRSRSEKNTRQHSTFLHEFPVGSKQAAEAIEWMKSLPLAIEFEDFRAVHACWDNSAVGRLRELSPDLVLGEELFHQAATKGHPVKADVEQIAKGPDLVLPAGYGIYDEEGTRRERVRVKWWGGRSTSWRDLAMSVADPTELPSGNAPGDAVEFLYGADELPVFFGHYWMQGTPELQAGNALCLDYSAGRDGPLVTYRHERGAPLSTVNICVHENQPRTLVRG